MKTLKIGGRNHWLTNFQSLFSCAVVHNKVQFLYQQGKQVHEMNLSEKITRERRRLGMSQEQLADRLGITRQSVSKWEAGTSTPEISKLVAMSELFQVSLDYMLKDYLEEEDRLESGLVRKVSGEDRQWEQESRREQERYHEEENRRIEEKVDALARYIKGYQYTSKTKIAGIPLVSVRFSRNLGKDSVAKGIIAIGNIAIGVISFGALSVGVISLGAVALGLLAIAALAVGLLAWGAVAIGVVAFGSAVVGIYSAGVAAYGREIAVGVSAFGRTAIGETARGENCLVWYEGIQAVEIEKFLDGYHPGLWKPLKDVLVMFGTHIG
ncbi:helix-turn-helix domain-containing protein [Bariatricus sp. SGI.154]|uniref:helix-turn-helix domain-containing protein n=1 Tax=Bariatricus sp. SGI.154 TaxID=3420549 RepID=UPI003D025360